MNQPTEYERIVKLTAHLMLRYDQASSGRDRATSILFNHLTDGSHYIDKAKWLIDQLITQGMGIISYCQHTPVPVSFLEEGDDFDRGVLAIEDAMIKANWKRLIDPNALAEFHGIDNGG